MTVNLQLEQLLKSDEFDWDNLKHREMLLRTWVKQGFRAFSDDENSENPSQENSVE